MATNKFLIFDEQGANMQTDAEYQSATQRIGGVLPGLAEPEMHNKLYRQVSIMAAAIGKVLAEAGYNADDSNMNALAANIKALFVSKPLDAYPVGAIYISTSSVSPSQLFGGTWQQIQGRFLLASSSTYAAGSTGGEVTHTLTTNEIPSHKHTVSLGAAGSHTHTITETAAGSHTHTITETAAGSHTHTITISSNGDHKHGFAYPLDEFGFDVTGGGEGPRQRGAFGDNYPYAGNVLNTESKMKIAGSHTHAGSISQSSNHTHTITAASVDNHTHELTAANVSNHNHTVAVSNTGGGAAHNNMPPYLSVYVWKRTA